MARARPQAVEGSWSGAKATDALLRPVRAGNAFEETVERLRVSRVTLREALRELQRAGYVDSRRGRYGGTFVRGDLPARRRRSGTLAAEARRRDLEDALVLRQVVETGAAAEAAARGIGVLEERYLRERLEACTNAADVGEYRRMDSRLHIALAELTGSPSLTSAVADARARINALLDDIPALGQNLRHGDAQHAEIVDAVVAHDPERARRAMAEHIEGTALLLRGFLD